MIRLNLTSLETEAVGRAADYILDASPQPDPTAWGRESDRLTDRHLAALVRVVRKIGLAGKTARPGRSGSVTADRLRIEDEMDGLVALAEQRIRAVWAALPPGTQDRAGVVARQLGLYPEDVAEVVVAGVGSPGAAAEAGLLSAWQDAQAAAIRQAWDELPTDVRASDLLAVQAVAARLCLTPTQVTAVIFTKAKARTEYAKCMLCRTQISRPVTVPPTGWGSCPTGLPGMPRQHVPEVR